MKAFWLAVALLPGLAAAAPQAPQRPREATRAQPPHAAALGKLEAELRRHLRQHGGRAPLPWRDAVVMPDTEQLVWSTRALRWNKGRVTFRVALDPSTRWYYVIRSDRRGPEQYFGPIDELPDGRFVDWRSGAR
jgi:hypothetical protein